MPERPDIVVQYDAEHQVYVLQLSGTIDAHAVDEGANGLRRTLDAARTYGCRSYARRDGMNDIHLLDTTGDSVADRAARGVVALFEAVFPARVVGYFVEGSFASQTAVTTSDLDLIIVFKLCVQRSTKPNKPG